MWLIPIVAIVLALTACGDGERNYITGPSAPGSVQNIALSGPAVQSTKSPCAGNVNVNANGTQGDDNRPTGDRASSGANAPDCGEAPVVVTNPVVE